MSEKLNIIGLKNVVGALNDAIDIYTHCSSENHALLNTLRSGLIQNFEIAYEMSWKFMKRWLEINISPDIVLGLSRKEFYRIARENLLITDVEKWWSFHEARNKTSYVYDEIIADKTVETAIEFLPYAMDFISKLEEKV
ncbi:HI0074 family nucleotidyltransferase substrate-binding subunit [Methanobrevibacter filiformis]|uniref:Nucleotidyltransferase substrate binding protein like protein n=1 Tax=Methanobrevibacter filiformis TaxID=55758 RepID=A0A166DC02_9EURY|nr:HI0074 family nucleotidyltransferase substrate-binding subunit [Methanobrevibacter filiformis]KZX15428.1 nucleotidyltransferase substrate binding protein like protein [Methanobrevibacter filiformis]